MIMRWTVKVDFRVRACYNVRLTSHFRVRCGGHEDSHTITRKFMVDLKALFDKYHDEYLKFDRIEHKLSRRRDLHAFLLLDALLPDGRTIVSAAEHDVFYLDIDVEALAKTSITEELVRDLHRCGVRYENEFDCLALFV